MKKIGNSGHFAEYLTKMYAGMFAGALFLTACVMVFGLATNIFELGNLLLINAGTAFLFFIAHLGLSR